MCSTKYDFNIPDLHYRGHITLLPSISKHLEKITILTDQIIHTLKMSLCASVCNNTLVIRPLFIEAILLVFA